MGQIYGNGIISIIASEGRNQVMFKVIVQEWFEEHGNHIPPDLKPIKPL